MYIKHLEQISSIDKVVPVDLFPVFWQILLQCYLSRCVFYVSHKFPCRSLLLSTTVLNDTHLCAGMFTHVSKDENLPCMAECTHISDMVHRCMPHENIYSMHTIHMHVLTHKYVMFL